MNTIYPNDPRFGEQWPLYNAGQFGGKQGVDINALAAWSIANSSPNVVVAVIDTGIQLDHPDLKDNIWINQDEIPGNNNDDDNNGYKDDINGWSFANNSPDPLINENILISHGTHVAGIIGATGNNGIGITGLTWDVQIMPIDTASVMFTSKNNGETEYPENDPFVPAIKYAVDNGASIIHLSQGAIFKGLGQSDNNFKGQSYNDWKKEYPVYSELYFNAIKQAVDNGVTVVVSAGNNDVEIGTEAKEIDTEAKEIDANNIIVPGIYSKMLEGVIAVGAITDTGGPTGYTNWGDFVDISAPGGNGVKGDDDRRDFLSTNKNSSYLTTTGTSMSAPLVTGTIALMLEIDPSLKPAKIEKILEESAIKSQSLRDNGLGEGLILDVEAALRMTKELLDVITEPAPSLESSPSSRNESNQLNDGFTQFTDADDVLTNQSDLKYRLMGGDDYLEVVGGLNNFANGNMGADTIILRGGKGEYLGGKDSDTFEVNDAEVGTLISANRGEDIITGSVSGVIYRAGKDDDVIAVSQGKAWGDLGKDVFRGVNGEGYAEIQDYTIGEDVVELAMDGSWSNVGDGLMFTDTTGDKLMLLLGINDIKQVTVV